MRKVIVVALILAALIFLLPMLLRQEKSPGEEELTLPESGHTLSILVDGQVQEMDLNEYLWGVVAAEMPASFEQEALKAQAVAARTYALNKAGKSRNHPQADLCTDYACCQAWISREKARANWGDKAVAYSNKITKAVAETGTKVILYNGQMIDAVFHSSSSHATKDAVEVWGNSVPYLKSVSSPEGEEVPNFNSEVTMSPQELKDAVLKAYPEAVLEGDPAGWIGETITTPEGGVQTMVIGGVTITGAQARQIFSQRSASFTVALKDGNFVFSVAGFGHGVGMSQYGADAMAKEGKTYQEILSHYYTGVTVEDCPAEALP
ncbi:stage II sporulation protein D [Evtepia sp.]|uniref:stage II sporulation protein D n=1 Tax=Evtepia sp. TaxID=2773933 RepID=UPI002A7482E3|nr:stage II sporulation protein D [Evtepia sp.]